MSIFATAWDALADLFALFEGDVAVCIDCRVKLKGPAIAYGGGSMQRNHYGDRCVNCHIRRFHDGPLMALWAKWTRS